LGGSEGKKAEKEGRGEGVDALIRDTRGDKKESRKKAAPKKKAATKKKPALKKKAAPKKKAATEKKPALKKKAAPKKKAATEKKPALKKKAAPRKRKKVKDTAVEPLEAPVTAPAVEAAVKPPEPAPAPKTETTAVRPSEEKKAVKEKTRAGDGTTRPASDSEAGESIQFLGFRLVDEAFAFNISCVREVLTYTPVTVVPQTREFMAGVINLRGSVVPVVDLRLLFGLVAAEPTVDTCIIIVEMDYDGESMLVGAIADAVREVFSLKASEIEPAPSMGTHLDVDFLEGMGKKDDEFVLILNTGKIFTPEALEA
jgi:purine-binding chemotaxis protein CheW